MFRKWKQISTGRGRGWNTEHQRNLGALARNRAGKPGRLKVGEDNIFLGSNKECGGSIINIL